MSLGHWCGIKATDPKPIIYHGAHRSDAIKLIQKGQRCFCISYYDILRQPGYDKHPGMQKENRAFLDSGAFSVLALGAKVGRKELDAQCEKYCETYAEWVRNNGTRFDFYITFDYAVEAPLVMLVTKRLQKLGIHPTPVYHGDSSLDWLQKYIDLGFKLIALSKRNFLRDQKRLFQYYDQCFNIGERAGVKFHSFASGLGPEVWKLPWYSVDSTSLVKASGFGTLLIIHHGIIKTVEVSNRGQKVDGQVLDFIKARGYDIKQLAAERSQRVLFNAETLTELQRQRKGKEWTKRTLF